MRFAERALEDGRKSVLAVHKGQLNAKQICDAVDAGDALAQELFDEYCGNLANGLASFVNLFQPESIVLGGGLAGYGEKLLEPLRMLTFPQTFRGEDQNTEIVCASLGNDAGLVGAAMLVEYSLAKRTNLACPARAQEGRHQGFHSLVNHPFPKIVWRKSESGDRFEKENGRGFFLP